MKEKIEASSAFAEDWLSYEERILDSQDILLLPHLKKHKRGLVQGAVCDLGCGSGRLSRILREETKKKIHAFDINSNLLDHASIYGSEGITYEKLDISKERIPLSNGECSFIFSNCLLMHLDSSGIENLVSESYRILKPDGSVFLSVTHYQWAQLMYETHTLKDDELVTKRGLGENHLLEYFRSPEWYCRLLEQMGFNQVRHEEILITNDTRLSSRYTERFGSPLFSVLTAKK